MTLFLFVIGTSFPLNKSSVDVILRHLTQPSGCLALAPDSSTQAVADILVTEALVTVLFLLGEAGVMWLVYSTTSVGLMADGKLLCLGNTSR